MTSTPKSPTALQTLAALACLAAATHTISGTPTQATGQAAADYSARLAGRALLILHNGQVVFERYDNRFQQRLPHPLASGTKSFTGVLAAAAIHDGIIPSWDAKVSDAIPEWAADPLKRDITVRQLLNLSSGLDPADALLGGRGGGRLLGAGAEARQRRLGGDDRPPAPDNHFAAALQVPMAGKPGQQFAYGPSHFYAFGAYLEARLAAVNHPQTTFRAYFDARLAQPIGLNVAAWQQDAAGKPATPGGMLLTAREWAKFGEFVRLGGAVRQPDGSLTQLIRQDLMDELFKPSPANPVYGLTWWLPGATGDTDAADSIPDADNARDRLRRRAMAEQMSAITDANGAPLRIWMAAGLGKQRLIILPDHGVVIVRFAEATPRGLAYSDAELISRVMGWKQP